MILCAYQCKPPKKLEEGVVSGPKWDYRSFLLQSNGTLWPPREGTAVPENFAYVNGLALDKTGIARA